MEWCYKRQIGQWCTLTPNEDLDQLEDALVRLNFQIEMKYKRSEESTQARAIRMQARRPFSRQIVKMIGEHRSTIREQNGNTLQPPRKKGS